MFKFSSKKLMLAGAALAVSVFGGSGVALASTPPTSQPYVVLSSYYGLPGDTFTVNGYGFGGEETVVIAMQAQKRTVRTDSMGKFSQQLPVSDVAAGTYDVKATGTTYNDTAVAKYGVGRYYGVAQPSSYYVLPRHGLSISGTSFKPGEAISVVNTTSNTSELNVHADAQGKFETPNRMVAYNQANTKQTFVVKGQTSGSMSTFVVTVGTYYPELTPSSYYVSKGSQVTIKGKNFAPFEGVRLFVNGQLAAKATAGGDGSIGSTGDLTITAPMTGDSFVLTATGTQVGDSVSRTITLK